MTRTSARRAGLLGLALTILGTASPRTQELRTITASTQSHPSTILTMCGQSIRLPSSVPQPLPPSTSGPVVYQLGLCFEPEGYRSRFAPEKYTHDIHLKASRPSQGQWILYDEAVEKVIFEDFQRLWKSNALANLSIDIRDFQFFEWCHWQARDL
jgi:hypothetical protein